jgi:hypothetical protein
MVQGGTAWGMGRQSFIQMHFRNRMQVSWLEYLAATPAEYQQLHVDLTSY